MDALEPLITTLHNEGRLRVWSLVVTVFGDAVQMRGGRIATLRLQHLLERVGVEAGALRTALSRLTHDGWVLRDREGRNSFYRLSESGQAEIMAAAVDIYRSPVRGKISDWKMVSGEQAPLGGLKVAANLWLMPASHTPDLSNYICVTGALTSFPEQFAQQVLTRAHQEALVTLSADINALNGAVLSPLDAMAARLLLLHRWRRIVLRFPDIPPDLFAAGAGLKNPRKMVAQAYQQLVDLSEEWLDSPDHGMMPMPASTPEFMCRFGRSETASASQLGGGS